MNGNQAVALGAIASGMALIAMYPLKTVVIVPATIEGCFHAMVTARPTAETFRMLVVVFPLHGNREVTHRRTHRRT